MDAIHCEQEDSVATLVKCGAHLGSVDIERTAQEVTAAASRGLVHRLSLYKKAGAYLGTPDCAGRTPLHVVSDQLVSLNCFVVSKILTFQAQAHRIICINNWWETAGDRKWSDCVS